MYLVIYIKNLNGQLILDFHSYIVESCGLGQGLINIYIRLFVFQTTKYDSLLWVNVCRKNENVISMNFNFKKSFEL